MEAETYELAKLLAFRTLDNGDDIHAVRDLILKIYDATSWRDLDQALWALDDLSPEELHEAVGGIGTPEDSAKRLAEFQSEP